VKQNRVLNFLNLQSLLVAGFAAAVWPIISQLKIAERWAKAREAGIASLPPVSIILPARNEEKNIEKCLRSLLSQSYPDFEVIAVDDGSQDATPQILARLAPEYPNLKIVTLEGKLPEGWSGKVHAMHNGVKAARPQSQWFLFSDADTVHYPNALEFSITRALQNKLDLFSALSKLELVSFWEKLLMPLVILGISLQYPEKKVNSEKSKLAIANGQYLLLRREAFEQVGGWETLKNSIVDDRDMAVLMKSSGKKIAVYNGEKLLQVRMYTGLKEIWQGFGKNAFVGSRAAYVIVPFFAASLFVAGLLPFVQLFYAMLKWLTPGKGKVSRLFWHSLFQISLLAIMRRRLDRALGIPANYTLFTPLATPVWIGILLDSMWRSIKGGGVVWKGRTYANPTKTQKML